MAFPVPELKHPLISRDSKGLGERPRLLQQLCKAVDEGPEPVLGHVGYQVVERGALADREWERVLTVLDLRWRSMPRLSPAAPSKVSRTTAKALSSSSRSRRWGSAMRATPRPMPKRRSLVSRKLGSTVHLFE